MPDRQCRIFLVNLFTYFYCQLFRFSSSIIYNLVVSYLHTFGHSLIRFSSPSLFVLSVRQWLPPMRGGGGQYCNNTFDPLIASRVQLKGPLLPIPIQFDCKLKYNGHLYNSRAVLGNMFESMARSVSINRISSAARIFFVLKI